MKRARFAVAFLSLASALASVPAFAGTVYTSGPGNYTLDAWTLNYGYMVSDEFTLAAPAIITGATFDVWTYPGDTLVSVDWSIGNSQFGGAVTTAATTGVFDETNPDNFPIYTESFSIPSLSLAAGTYFFTLQGADVPGEDPIYWDENDGASIGYESAYGSISTYDCLDGYGCALSGGETFTLQGNATTPEPSSFLLLGSGLAGLAGMIRRRIKA